LFCELTQPRGQHVVSLQILEKMARSRLADWSSWLVIRDHGVNMYVVYIWKWISAYALGGVSGVASFITTDEQLQLNRDCCFLVQAMLPEAFTFIILMVIKGYGGLLQHNQTVDCIIFLTSNNMRSIKLMFLS